MPKFLDNIEFWTRGYNEEDVIVGDDEMTLSITDDSGEEKSLTLLVPGTTINYPAEGPKLTKITDLNRKIDEKRDVAIYKITKFTEVGLTAIENWIDYGMDRLNTLNLINAKGRGSVSQKGFEYAGDPIEFTGGTKGSQPGDVIPGSEATGSNSVALGGVRYDYYTSQETHDYNLTIDPTSTKNWGRTPTSAEGNQSFAAGGSCHAYGDWSIALGRDSKAYQHLTFACGGAVKAGMSEEEWEAFPNKQADFFRTDYKDAQSFAAAFGESSYAKSRSGFAACMANKVEPEAKASAAFGETNQVWGQKCLVAGTSNKVYKVSQSCNVGGYNNQVYARYTDVYGVSNVIGSLNSNPEAVSVKGRENTLDMGSYTTIEGYNNTVRSGVACHIEGRGIIVTLNEASHVEGVAHECTAGSYTHIEGHSHKGSFGDYNHIEGSGHKGCSGIYNHIEGCQNNHTSGNSSHVEGYSNTSSGAYNHTGGAQNTNEASFSTMHGQGLYAKGTHNALFGSGNRIESSYGIVAGLRNKLLGGSYSAIFGSDNIKEVSGKDHQFVAGGYHTLSSSSPAGAVRVGVYSLLDNSMFSIGGGSNNPTTYGVIRHNLVTIEENGNFTINQEFDRNYTETYNFVGKCEDWMDAQYSNNAWCDQYLDGQTIKYKCYGGEAFVSITPKPNLMSLTDNTLTFTTKPETYSVSIPEQGGFSTLEEAQSFADSFNGFVEDYWKMSMRSSEVKGQFTIEKGVSLSSFPGTKTFVSRQTNVIQLFRVDDTGVYYKGKKINIE